MTDDPLRTWRCLSKRCGQMTIRLPGEPAPLGCDHCASSRIERIR